MLISFSAENFLSFRDKAELSMVAVESDHSLPNNRVEATFAKEKSQPLPLLKSAVFYGPNAGGKSNFLAALNAFSAFVVNSANMHENQPASFPSFMLDPKKRTSPSEFEIRVLLNGVRFRYGFSADSKHVHDEWFFISETGRERFVFERTWNQDEMKHTFEFGPLGKRFEKIHRDGAIRSNALLLSIASQSNIESAKNIVEYISRVGRKYTFDGSIEDTRYIPILTSALRFADIGINSIIATQQKQDSGSGTGFLESIIQILPGTPEQRKHFSNWLFGRNKLEFVYSDTEGNEVALPASVQSEGTYRFFTLMMQLSYIYVNGGGLLTIDEFDRSLHPVLCEAFINFIHQLPDARLQLICTTHNPLPLNQDIFRRDQVWIVEKDPSGASTLTALSDFKGLRREHRLGKQYLEGRFGGLPILDSSALEKMLQQLAELSSKENH